MAKNNYNELEFEDLLSELGDNSNTLSLGGYKFKELTMQDQRKILSMGFNPIEIPVRMSNMHNEYIKSSVELEDDNVDIMSHVGVDIKPYIILALRILTLGEKYIDGDTGKKYTLRKVTDADFKKVVEPRIIELNDFIIRLGVPSLSKDTSINTQLLNALAPYKKNIKDDDYGKIADIYQMYELMKYITEIELKGNVFDFERCPVNKKMKIINSFPQRVISQISDYVEVVKENENEALTMTNDETQEESKVTIDALFYSKFARDSKEPKK